MGLLSDFFFGESKQNNKTRKKSSNQSPSLFDSDYDDYYEETYEDALLGDEDAIDEMREEFGDDWEDEY
ncbi:hypothetical protein [Treponema pectinovorum]|uniref:hypothetical protein n=1 Tax=Treponema pectinovorum TaxID=164 RepID=UPI0011CA148E|nr:hypothetical protein [Treponema pectinovorum]